MIKRIDIDKDYFEKVIFNNGYTLCFYKDCQWKLNRGQDKEELFSRRDIAKVFNGTVESAFVSLLSVFALDIDMYNELQEEDEFLKYLEHIVGSAAKVSFNEEFARELQDIWDCRNELNPHSIFYAINLDMPSDTRRDVLSVPRELSVKITMHDETGLGLLMRYEISGIADKTDTFRKYHSTVDYDDFKVLLDFAKSMMPASLRNVSSEADIIEFAKNNTRKPLD